MSDVLEKTLAALPKFFGESVVQGSQAAKTLKGLGPSFQNFVRLLHKTKSKHEVEQFISAQLVDMKEQMSNPAINQERIQDLLFQCVYCRMLGYKVDFAKIRSLNMLVVTNDAVDSKIGFLSANLLLDRNDEISIMATSSILKNLCSRNLLFVLNAIPTAAHLSVPRIIECLLPNVLKVMMHNSKGLIRAKAVMCIHVYNIHFPQLFMYQEDQFYKSLCDPDPSVMSATCHIFYELVQKEKSKYLNLVPILVNIMQQVIDRKLPACFEFHSIPSPWLQIKILKMWALLGNESQRESQMIYTVLKTVFERTVMKDNRMAFAICYECIVTSTSIYPNQELLQTAAQSVGNFLRSKDITLKYIGIKALTGLVRVSKEFALQYQMIVVELLDDPDETIKRKTLTLLYNMTNSINVQPVCDKLLQNMVTSSDLFHKEELLHKIIELTHKFFKPEIWFVDVLFEVLQICPSSSSEMVMNKVISTLKGSLRNIEFCQHLVKKSVECMFRKDLLPDVSKLASWIIGQQSVLLKNMPKDKLMALFTKQLSGQHTDVMTKLWLVTVLVKLVNSNILTTDILIEAIKQLTTSENSLLIKEKLQELVRMSQTKLQITEMKHKKMDFTLSFLDTYVSKSLSQGSSPYKPKHMRYKQTQQEKGVTDLFKGLQNQASNSMTGSGRIPDDVSTSDVRSLTNSDNVSQLPSVKKVWGKDGRISESKESELGKKENEQISEEDKNRQEMISALFGGIASNRTDKIEDSTTDPFFADEDTFDIKNVKTTSAVYTGGWRKLNQSLAEYAVSNLTDKNLFFSDNLTTQDEDQTLQSDTSKIFNSEHSYFKHQNDDDYLEKHLGENDSLIKSGDDGSSNLYDDFLEDNIKWQEKESNMYLDPSKSVYDDDSIS